MNRAGSADYALGGTQDANVDMFEDPDEEIIGMILLARGRACIASNPIDGQR